MHSTQDSRIIYSSLFTKQGRKNKHKNNLTNDRVAYYNNSHTALTTGVFSDEFVKPFG